MNIETINLILLAVSVLCGFYGGLLLEEFNDNDTETVSIKHRVLLVAMLLLAVVSAGSFIALVIRLLQ